MLAHATAPECAQSQTQLHAVNRKTSFLVFSIRPKPMPNSEDTQAITWAARVNVSAVESVYP